MNKLICSVVSLMIITLSSSVGAEDMDLANIFRSRNLVGTIVISSMDGGQTYIQNEERAKTRFLPASTFKIPNTLIALEEGAVADGKEIIKWDGKDRGVSAWNKDQSIETAFQPSCVWFYQEMAKRVGISKYAPYLQKMQYGNALAGPEVTTFWLEGDLRISAIEQVAFLRKLYKKEFAFKPSSYELLKKIMFVEQNPTYTLWAKTGWATKVPPPVGWITGYVESGDKVWFFATNMEMARIEDAPLRKDITMEALKIKGIIK
jgi:beta-lactamase class D